MRVQIQLRIIADDDSVISADEILQGSMSKRGS